MPLPARRGKQEPRSRMPRLIYHCLACCSHFPTDAPPVVEPEAEQNAAADI